MCRQSIIPNQTRHRSGPLGFAWRPAIVGLTLTFVVLSPPLASGATPTVKEIVERLDARVSAFQNIHTSANWEYFQQSKTSGAATLARQSWDQQEIYSDGFRRIRMISRPGSFSPDGKRVPLASSEVYYLFDGEKTVYGEYFPGSDRNGEPIPASKKISSTSNSGYRTAQVHDGPFPQPDGPWKYNNPLTFMDGVKRAFLSALTEGRDPKVAEDPGKKGIYLVTYTLDPNIDSFHLTYVARVDANLGWVVTGFYANDSEGRRLIECGNEYRTLDDGLVVPTGGFWRNWSVDELKVPLTEKRYNVETIAVNDPNFSDDIFKIVLEPDTAVSDIRYHVDYRVGAERLIDANLSVLAQDAKKTQAVEEESRSRSGGSSPIRRVVLIWTAVTLLGVCLAIFVVMFRPRQAAWDGVENDHRA